MRAVWFIARTEISHQMRRRETLLWVFVMPILFFYFIGTVTGGIGVGPGERRDRLALRAPANGGFLADELVRRLEAQQFSVERPATDAAFDRFTRRLTVPAPADGKTFTEAVLAGERQIIDYRSRAEGPGADYERIRVARAVYTLLADLAVAGDAGRAPDAGGVRAVATASRPIRLEVTSAGRRLDPPSGYAQTIPGTMVMFTMLVLLTGGAISVVVEREQGLLRRLASTPISRGSLVTGKWIGKLLLGLVQLAFALVAGTVLFQMNWGGSLPMVIVVLIGWAAFCASLGFLLGNVVRTTAQMSGAGVLTTLVLAALGGCWWPIEITPRWMQHFALALPTGWAMDAMHKLISFGDGPASVLPHLVAILFGAVVLGVASARTFRYQ